MDVVNVLQCKAQQALIATSHLLCVLNLMLQLLLGSLRCGTPEARSSPRFLQRTWQGLDEGELSGRVTFEPFESIVPGLGMECLKSFATLDRARHKVSPGPHLKYGELKAREPLALSSL